MMFVGRFAGTRQERVKIEATTEMVRSPEEVLALIKRGEGAHLRYLLLSLVLLVLVTDVCVSESALWSHTHESGQQPLTHNLSHGTTS
jgi:hypothetical protein